MEAQNKIILTCLHPARHYNFWARLKEGTLQAKAATRLVRPAPAADALRARALIQRRNQFLCLATPGERTIGFEGDGRIARPSAVAYRRLSRRRIGTRREARADSRPLLQEAGNPPVLPCQPELYVTVWSHIVTALPISFWNK